MTTLGVVATEQERDALLKDVAFEPVRIGPYDAVRTAVADVVVCGLGPAAAAACAGAALALGTYDLAASIGICGAFRGTAETGDIVVATELVAADLGADSPSGFLGLGALGWGDEVAYVDPELVTDLAAALGDVVVGPVLTVSTVTGRRSTADELARRHGAVAEGMEGWGVFEAARTFGVPTIEVRTVSNLVGDRDISTWDFGSSFGALSVVGARLLGRQWR